MLKFSFETLLKRVLDYRVLTQSYALNLNCTVIKYGITHTLPVLTNIISNGGNIFRKYFQLK